MRRLRRQVTYANVASTIALVLALGAGGAYAAGKIGSREIKKGAVHTRQIGNRQVKRQDIAGGSINSGKVSNSTLTGKDLKDDSLSGLDVNEGSLGIVPQSSTAQSVNGVKEQLVRASQPDPTVPSLVTTIDGLAISLTCGLGNDAAVFFRGSDAADRGTVTAFQSNSPDADTHEFSSVSNGVSTAGASTSLSGFATMRRASGRVVRFDFELREDPNGFGTSDDCFLSGFARSAQ
jgi:hypothetical protein